MALNYEQRRRAERVSSHTVPKAPQPTLADIDALVFDQTWKHTGTSTLTSLMVLAADADQAAELGAMRLAQQLNDVSALVIVKNTPREYFDVATHEGVLRIETAEEWQHRQDTHKTEMERRR